MTKALPLAAAIVALAVSSPVNAQTPAPPTLASVLAATTPDDWRPLDPENTLYLDLPGGRVIIELAPAFAPGHVANVKALAREGYFDGLSVIRAQDNYVAQWGDPSEDEAEARRAIKTAKRTLPAEFDRKIAPDLAWTPLPDGDVYAPEVGWSGGFPAARDPKEGRAWLAYCYGALGAARGNDPASGGGTELFVVIGHAPRHLDRNVTAFGRVVRGIELLSSLPRGTGALGFYEKPEERVPLEALRTDGAAFRALVEARRNRREEWFKHAAGKVELCNVPLPVRERPAR